MVIRPIRDRFGQAALVTNSRRAKTLENVHSSLRTRKLRMPGPSSAIRIDAAASPGSDLRSPSFSRCFRAACPRTEFSRSPCVFFTLPAPVWHVQVVSIITEQGCSGQSPRQKSPNIVTASRLESIKSCLMMRHENAVDTNMKSIDTELKWNGASLLLLLGRFALTLTCIVHRNSSGDSSTRSSSVGVSPPATTKFAGNCLAMADWQPSASGCTLMNPRPSYSSY